ncbi:MAG: hypothetical protein WBN32_11920, partial [Woeseia sp.]
MNEGVIEFAFSNMAPLPLGIFCKDHKNDNGSLLASLERLPSRLTTDPAATAWSAPASAIGAKFGDVTVKENSVVPFVTVPFHEF